MTVVLVPVVAVVTVTTVMTASAVMPVLWFVRMRLGI
jgi:hypothetical protein